MRRGSDGKGCELTMKRAFMAAMKAKVLELLIYDEIGENFWTGGGITAGSVGAAIKAAGDFDSIVLRINSPGGSCFDGVAIYNLIRAQKKPVTVFVDGLAASAASDIAMAGDEINMGSGAMIMIHNAMWGCYGDANDLRQAADAIEKISVTVAEIYIARTGNGADVIKAMMDAETWMSGADAVEKGFATRVVEQDARIAADAKALAATFNLKSFKNAPKFAVKTKRVDGEDLEKSAFAYQGGDETKDWHLPIEFSTAEKTESHIRDAISRWDQTDMPDAAEKKAARTRILDAAKEHNIDVSEDSLKLGAETPTAAVNVDCECDCNGCMTVGCASCEMDPCDAEGCDCPNHQAMAAGHAEMEIYRHRLKLRERAA